MFISISVCQFQISLSYADIIGMMKAVIYIPVIFLSLLFQEVEIRVVIRRLGPLCKSAIPRSVGPVEVMMNHARLVVDLPFGYFIAQMKDKVFVCYLWLPARTEHTG